MLAAAASTSQPILAGLFGLCAAGLAGAVVAMAWSVHARQIRLAELLARRQFILTREPDAPEHPLNGHATTEAAVAEVQETLEAVGARGGPGTVRLRGPQGAPPAAPAAGAGAPQPPGPGSWSSRARRPW
jgi:hypothetical protein